MEPRAARDRLAEATPSARPTAAPQSDLQPSPVEHFRAVLERHAERVPESRRRVLVLTHRGPDPDAIAACEGIRHLCRAGFGLEAEVATVGRIHRAENLAMVRALGLTMKTYDEIQSEDFFGAVLVDTQPEFGHTFLPEAIPVLAIFDHHVPPNDAKRGVTAEHRDVRLGLGATASMIYEYLRDAKVEVPKLVATALFCGVRYDTADLSRNSSTLDEEAYYSTFRLADRGLITSINHPPLPRAYYVELKAALDIARVHGPLVIALLGNVSHPEFVAEMADFFLRMKGISWVVVGGACEDESEYVLSLRTDYAFGNAYPLMARVLDGMGSFGGHGHIAGARVPMDDCAKSTVACVERKLRGNALAVLGTAEEGELPPEGDPLV
jgi:nanoRNase/pAp phosphatase (c-di-AMP/oligoRNAs hydrolase)